MKLRLLATTAAAIAFAQFANASTLSDLVEAANADALAAGANVQIGMVEWINNGESEQLGQTILFKNVGNKQLAFDFVPGDPRRHGGTDIRYRTDGTEPSADAVATFGAIDSAMTTWDNETCSTIPITDLGDTAADIGFVQAFFGFGGNPSIVEPLVAGADISHDGFLPPGFFNLLAPGGGGFILGVTFTIIFVDGSGNPTDIDNNGTFDAAYREIYYNDGFTWENDPNDVPGDGRVDLETVALHESGHGLSQAHFGQGAIINANGNLRLSPQAVMNAAYIFGQQSLLGTDTGGHCSNWGQWPNN
jgi:hypothetical protein